MQDERFSSQMHADKSMKMMHADEYACAQHCDEATMLSTLQRFAHVGLPYALADCRLTGCVALSRRRSKRQIIRSYQSLYPLLSAIKNAGKGGQHV